MKTLTTSLAFALVLCAAGFAQDMQGMQHNGMEMKATPATKAIAVLMQPGARHRHVRESRRRC
jgi:hypothetical protein